MRDAAHHRTPAPSLNQGRSLVARPPPTPFHEPAPLSDGRQRRELLRTEEVSERVRRILRLSGGVWTLVEGRRSLENEHCCDNRRKRDAAGEKQPIRGFEPEQ
jgi:hypothetical protein